MYLGRQCLLGTQIEHNSIDSIHERSQSQFAQNACNYSRFKPSNVYFCIFHCSQSYPCKQTTNDILRSKQRTQYETTENKNNTKYKSFIIIIARERASAVRYKWWLDDERLYDECTQADKQVNWLQTHEIIQWIRIAIRLYTHTHGYKGSLGFYALCRCVWYFASWTWAKFSVSYQMLSLYIGNTDFVLLFDFCGKQKQKFCKSSERERGRDRKKLLLHSGVVGIAHHTQELYFISLVRAGVCCRVCAYNDTLLLLSSECVTVHYFDYVFLCEEDVCESCAWIIRSLF